VPHLDQARILDAAISLADAHGIEPLTIRRLAAELDVGTMSIYHYLPNKEAILDAMVDHVFSEIHLPDPDQGWRDALHNRCVSMREALRRHPWALGLMDSRRNPGPATLQHHESLLACLRSAGFSIPATAHTFALLDAYVYGFALQAASLPFAGRDELQDIAEDLLTPELAATIPHMAEFATEHALQPGYDFEDEFERGLQVVLDGIAQTWAPGRLRR
jgi:AcrR family transcriptional regulator